MASLVRRMQIRTFKARTDVEKIPTGRINDTTGKPIKVWPQFASNTTKKEDQKVCAA